MLPKDAQLKSVPGGGNFSTSLERTFSASIGTALGWAAQPRGSRDLAWSEQTPEAKCLQANWYSYQNATKSK